MMFFYIYLFKHLHTITRRKEYTLRSLNHMETIASLCKEISNLFLQNFLLIYFFFKLCCKKKTTVKVSKKFWINKFEISLHRLAIVSIWFKLLKVYSLPRVFKFFEIINLMEFISKSHWPFYSNIIIFWKYWWIQHFIFGVIDSKFEQNVLNST